MAGWTCRRKGLATGGGGVGETSGGGSSRCYLISPSLPWNDNGGSHGHMSCRIMRGEGLKDQHVKCRVHI